jgi:hypothetical protein
MNIKLDIFKRISDTNSDTSSIYSNIFKSKKENFTTFLNRFSDQFFYEKRNSTLEKTFFNRALFDFELYILLILDKIKLKIVPEILEISDPKISRIVYNINEMISLREIFEKNTINFHYLINELLTFLKMIQYSKLLIGNLNIDTIYVKENSKLEFYIIDFSKANFTDKILDLDFQSLYISLNEGVSAPLRRLSQKNLNYFDQEFSRYTNKRLSKESFAENIIELYNTSGVY